MINSEKKIIKREPSKNEVIARLETTIGMYEKVFDLSRKELIDAYSTIGAHERVEDLARTELIQSKDDVKQAEYTSSVKSKFFSSISHEIRTPISLMLAPLEVMLEGEVGEFSEEQEAYLRLMYQNSRRLLKMVNEVLDFTKLEAGKMQLFYQETDICNVVRTIANTFAPFVEKKSINFEMNMPEKEIKIYIDIEKIEKVIINLVFNAFKYVNKEGDVKLDLIELPDSIEFSISNSGEGLPPNIVEKVFDRYTQFERFASKKEYSGTGLGLSLSKEFIEMHKGSISLESKLGGGTTFRFDLKKGLDHIDKDLLALGWGDLERRKDSKGEVKRELPTKGVSSLFKEITDFYSLKKSELSLFESAIKKNVKLDNYNYETKKKVLLIEDNKEMRGFLRYVLNPYFDFFDAVDGLDGYQKVLEIQPDLVISDIMMPGLNGFELTKKIKNNKSTCRIPVILLTAKANNTNAMLEGLNTGADDFLSKPFNVKELIARINALLRMESLHDHLISVEGVVYSLANAIEAKDSYTEGHCLRLSNISLKIADTIGLPAGLVASIKNGAILHDIGKIGIPENILSKPRPLDEEEFEIMKQHPLIGEKICEPFKNNTHIINIIRYHHERFDGKGYPEGLSGTDIPLEARIVSISDAFDAMIFSRVYRKGIGFDKAYEVFKNEKESGQWDPELVEIFLDVEKEDLRKIMGC